MSQEDQLSNVMQPWAEHFGAEPLWSPGAEAIARQLLAWGAQDPLVAAGLLHELVCEDALSVEQVRTLHGDHAAFLCAACCQIAQTAPPASWYGQPHALQRIQLFRAAYWHPEVALLHVARLWVEAFFAGRLKTNEKRERPPPQRSLGQTGLILPPALEMLGLHALREQLEDFLLQSGGDDALRQRAAANEWYTRVQKQIVEALPAARVSLSSSSLVGFGSNNARDATREFLAEQRNGPHPLNLHVVVADESACYAALQTLHRLYHPLDGGVVDTIYRCRGNGHRSLQTAVLASGAGRQVRLNIKIFTPTMERVNRWGVATLYFRAESAADNALNVMPLNILPLNILNDVAYQNAWWRDAARKHAVMESAPLGALNNDTVYVFSPTGELFSLERGSTVVDYAYHVHSDLAEQCRRFYVNGETVEPTTVLRHLDLVELEHTPRAPGPTLVWLNAARTKRARTRIRRFLRSQGEGINDGRRIMDARLQALEEHYRFHIPEHRVEDAVSRAARHMHLASADDLLAELAAGRLAADRFLHPLFADEIIRRIELPRGLRLRPHQVALAQCCKPRPGDDIVGHPHRREGVITKLTVHRSDCSRQRKPDPAGQAETVVLRWRLQQTTHTLAQVEVIARDDDGLLGEALHQIYSHLPGVALLRSEAYARRGVARLRFNLDADDQETLEEIVDSLRRLPNREISSVRQLTLPPSEHDMLMADNARAVNPYSRMPVNDSTMFFGRTEELARIHDWLRNGVACIWLRGQKRVGKTSLLFQLRRHFFESHEFVCAFVDFQLFSNLTQANIFFEVASAVFDELQSDPRVLALGAPDRFQFESDPPICLVHYLRNLQGRLGGKRLALLLDEFSRVTDLYLEGKLEADFFSQWRGLLQAMGRSCSFVTVVQQKTFENMLRHMRSQRDDPCWSVLELGETVHLRPLTNDDARRLIEWPMRNFLDFAPGVVDRLMHLTGGSPFLIQSFCSKLVTRMGHHNGRKVGLEDMEAVAEEFMQPSESIFAHLLDLIHGLGYPVSAQLAQLAANHSQESATWAEISAAMPEIAPGTLRSTLDQLCLTDILTRPQQEVWQFSNTLFQRWLVRNP